MNSKNRMHSKPHMGNVGLGVLVVAVGLCILMSAQRARAQRVALTEDWTSKHVIFSSSPGSFQEAMKAGSFEQWYRLVNDPRLYLQRIKRSAAPRLLIPATDGSSEAKEPLFTLTSQRTHGGPKPPPVPPPKQNPKPQGDWSYFLGTVSGARVQPANYPAKFTFDVNGARDCTNDYVAFALNQTASSTQPSIIAFNKLYSGPATAATALGTVSNNGISAGQTVTIKNGGTTLNLTASAPTPATGTATFNGNPSNDDQITVGATIYWFEKGTNGGGSGNCGHSGVGPCIAKGGTAAQEASNLKAALDNNSAECGYIQSGESTCLFGLPAGANPLVSSTVSPLTQVNLTATTAGSAGFTLTSTNTTNLPVSYTAGSDGSTSGVNFPYWSGSAFATTTQVAINIAAAINRGTNGSSVGLTPATSSANTVTVTAATAGTGGNAITLATTLTDFTWASSTLVGGNVAGTSPCTSIAPGVMWAYQAGSSATAILTSPVISGGPYLPSNEQGTMVAFVEKGSSSAILHVLKWKSGQGTSGSTIAPVVPDTTCTAASTCTPSGTWAGCLGGSTSCMFNLTYSTHTNSNSSPFYDYTNDAIYVGDDSGYLWKITGVFNGTPARAAAPWATGVTVHSGCILTGPVLDYGSNNIFVGDSCGRLSYVTSAGVLGTNTIGAFTKIVDAPIVDSSAARVFAFGASNSTTGSAAVVQANTTLTSASTVTANVGTSSTSVNVHDGVFDNNYYNNAGTGALYVCGNPGGTQAQLYRLTFNSSGVMSTTVGAGPALSTSAEECSPLAEIFNTSTSTDWLFAGVPANCSFGGSTTGCVESLNITGWLPSQSYSVGQIILDSNFNIEQVTSAGTSGAGPSPPTWSTGFQTTTSDSGVVWTNEGVLVGSGIGAEPGGTSGIVVDNVSTSGQASSLYYSNLSGSTTCGTAGGNNVTACAVKRTQAGLQ